MDPQAAMPILESKTQIKWTASSKSNQSPTSGRGNSVPTKDNWADSTSVDLLRLIHGDALRSRLFFGFGFFRGHGLINPFIGGFQIRRPGR